MPVIVLLAAGACSALLAQAGPRVRLAALALLVLAIGGWTIKGYFHDWRNDGRVWAAHSIGETLASQVAGDAERPARLYGADIASNYQGQGLKLSKHFRSA